MLLRDKKNNMITGELYESVRHMCSNRLYIKWKEKDVVMRVMYSEGQAVLNHDRAGGLIIEEGNRVKSRVKHRPTHLTWLIIV